MISSTQYQYVLGTPHPHWNIPIWFYVVKVGLRPIIYDTRDKAKAHVIDYTGNWHKLFVCLGDAEAYIKNLEVNDL